VLEFVEDKTGYQHLAADKARATYIGDSAVDDHTGIQQDRCVRGLRVPICSAQQRRTNHAQQVLLARDQSGYSQVAKQDSACEWEYLIERWRQKRERVRKQGSDYQARYQTHGTGHQLLHWDAAQLPSGGLQWFDGQVRRKNQTGQRTDEEERCAVEIGGGATQLGQAKPQEKSTDSENDHANNARDEIWTHMIIPQMLFVKSKERK
jgi:hypothetical protein